jgi:hypothetical protein
MYAKDRGKWAENQMSGLLDRLVIRPFDERSEFCPGLAVNC